MSLVPEISGPKEREGGDFQARLGWVVSGVLHESEVPHTEGVWMEVEMSARAPPL